MKRETDNQTISSLYDEYNKKVSEQKNNISRMRDEISDCDSRIARIEADIESNINLLTPEQYSQRMDEVNKIKSARELHTKRLSAFEGGMLKGFDTEEDKKAFIVRLRAVYKFGEDEFIRECDKHLSALETLLNERTEEASKGVSLAQSIGEYTLAYPSAVRKIVHQVVTSRKNVKE